MTDTSPTRRSSERRQVARRTSDTVSRRSFLVRSGLLGAAVATGATTGTLGSLLARTGTVLATPGTTTPHTLVCLFLRGGMDGLSALVPLADGDYVAARPTIAVSERRAIPLTPGWGLHPALGPLVPAWEAGRLALIPASGSPDRSRSHFSAMDAMEAGTPGDLATPMGWLARHVRTAHGLTVDPPAPATADRPSQTGRLATLAMGRMTPRSLRGHGDTVTIADASDVGLGGDAGVIAALRAMYGDTGIVNGGIDSAGGSDAAATSIDLAGEAALDVLAELDDLDLGPAPDPDRFGQSQLGHDLAGLARLLDADVPIEVAAVELGGWDLHQAMGDDTGGQMADRLDDLARALGGFWDHLADRRDHVTVVVMSEFGRRLAENSSAGTDHGNGGLMIVLGGRTRGGVHGEWHGLGADVLDRGDVPLLNDYRHVLGEIVDRSLGNGANLDVIFPGFDGRTADALRIVH